MVRRIAIAVGLSFLSGATLLAILDHVRVVYRPATDADWHAHYASLAAAPVEVAMLAYGRALLDFLHSPIPALGVCGGAALLLILQRLAEGWRDRRLGGMLSPPQRLRRLAALLADLSRSLGVPRNNVPRPF